MWREGLAGTEVGQEGRPGLAERLMVTEVGAAVSSETFHETS